MPIRLAARAVLLHQGRLLLVNAYPGAASDLWCAPGGGAEMHESLGDALMREVHEETGLRIAVGAPCLVNEFHTPGRDFHQVEIFFRCTRAAEPPREGWRDPAGVVTRQRWVTPSEMAGLRVKPDRLAEVAFSDGIAYDPLEDIVI